MSANKGTIVLMGSGELTSTMVEVHKSLLKTYDKSANAVFLDTPAGFQLNADHIAQKAIHYFKTRVQYPLQVASLKSASPEMEMEAQNAFGLLRKADYLLIGPGSPTYALRNWQQTPVPQIMTQRIEAGGCLVAASAAALTVGSQTLPVYEIYKVGMPVNWVKGLDILGQFGMNLVVIPHWNNAEGGNHDTRYCFMGAPRLVQLEMLLPEPTPILGLDEHTALIIDLARDVATIEGIGQVTLRWNGEEQHFNKNDQVPLSLLRGQFPTKTAAKTLNKTPAITVEQNKSLTETWETIHTLENNVKEALDRCDDQNTATNLLSLERHIWKSQDQLQEHDEMGAAREVFREVITLLMIKISMRPATHKACLAPLIEALLHLRSQYREQDKWEEADAIRDCLQKSTIAVEDGPNGAVWKLGDIKTAD